MNLNSQHILIVEDHKAMSQAVQTILESEGFSVSTATDGIEALELMDRTIPDLILADIMMPRMDGYTFYERVRTRREWIPIPFIFLTAKTGREERLRGKEMGVEDYIAKPFDAQDLIVSVRSRLLRARAIEAAGEAELERFKQQIAAVLGHELRTPLTYVTGYTDLALEDISSLTLEEVEEFLKSIKEGADRLNRLVQDLLLLVQIDSGRIQEEFVSLACRCDTIGQVVERVVGEYATKAERHEVVLAVEVDCRLPPVVLNEPLFSNALGRLIDNAIKFSRGNARRADIHVTRGRTRVRVSVSDNGVGIPADKQEQLFRRFSQINRQDLEQQGVGLGLAIARELISLHGGRILVDSTPGRGSTFTLCLPLAR